MSKKNLLYEPSEHDIQDAIMGRLNAEGFYTERRNAGQAKVFDQRGKKRMIKLSPAGTPDVEAFRKHICNGKSFTEHIFVEVKKPGNKPTLLQQIKMKELEEYGARCIVATSVYELEEKLGLRHS